MKMTLNLGVNKGRKPLNYMLNEHYYLVELKTDTAQHSAGTRFVALKDEDRIVLFMEEEIGLFVLGANFDGMYTVIKDITDSVDITVNVLGD